ncbi:MAG: pilus assembly protein [Asticcacaulis sp.]
MLRRFNSLRFFKAHDGAAAVEFALIAPILVVIYIGLTELGLGMMANRRTSHLAATVGDLVAQSESVTAANLTDIFDIGTSILQPFEGGTNLEIRVSSLKMGTDNKAHVEWSDDRNWTGTPYVENATTGTVITSVTTSQLPVGEYLIMTEASYTYTAPITKFLPAPVTFNYTFYHHPRSGGDVVRK